MGLARDVIDDSPLTGVASTTTNRSVLARTTPGKLLNHGSVVVAVATWGAAGHARCTGRIKMERRLGDVETL